MITYLVTREREGRWWSLHIPGLHIWTQARIGRFEIKTMARDAIAVILDVPGDSFKIKVIKI